MPRPRFIVDNNVGKLAVWLRILGYDTLFINPIDDRELVRLAREQQRIILTKDKGVLERKVVASGEVAAFFVESIRWREQLGAVAKHFRLNADQAFTRCAVCNEILVAIAHEQAQGLVPPDVLERWERLFECPKCGRVYWKGGHWERMLATLGSVITGGRTE